jgi:putative NADH-flavin reductase
MQITVFGASGKVGSLVVEEALRRGFTVVAFVHSHDLFSPSGKLILVKGDVHNAEDVQKALRSSDAVISCLGSWGGKDRYVLTAAMKNIIPAMGEQKITRIITLTGSGAYAPEDKAGAVHKMLFYFLAPYPAGKIFRDGEEHMRLLAESGLDWTTLRSPIMNNLGGIRYRLSLKSGLPTATISRRAVAVAMLDQLGSDEFLAHAPVIHRK